MLVWAGGFWEDNNPAPRHKQNEGLTMVDRINRINPVAKAMMQSRRRTQVVPDKKKYNRKRDKYHAGKDRQISHEADKQKADD